MILETFTGVTTKTIKVEDNLIGLIFEKNHATNGKLTTETVAITIYRGFKDTNVVDTKTPLQVLAEFEAAKTGAYCSDDLYSAFPIELCMDAIDLGTGKDHLTIELAGLDATATYRVFRMEPVDKQAHEPFRFSRHSIDNTTTAKSFQITDEDALILPVSNLVEIELRSATGKTQRLSNTEIAVAQRMQNDVVCMGLTNNDVVYGFQNYYVIAVATAVEVKITANGSNPYIFYTKA